MMTRTTRYQLDSDALTVRQAEIILWLAEGKTQREIALLLSVTFQAVEYNLRRVKSRLGAETATEAVVLCWTQGWMKEWRT